MITNLSFSWELCFISSSNSIQAELIFVSLSSKIVNCRIFPSFSTSSFICSPFPFWNYSFTFLTFHHLFSGLIFIMSRQWILGLQICNLFLEREKTLMIPSFYTTLNFRSLFYQTLMAPPCRLINYLLNRRTLRKRRKIQNNKKKMIKMKKKENMQRLTFPFPFVHHQTHDWLLSVLEWHLCSSQKERGLMMVQRIITSRNPRLWNENSITCSRGCSS